MFVDVENARFRTMDYGKVMLEYIFQSQLNLQLLAVSLSNCFVCERVCACVPFVKHQSVMHTVYLQSNVRLLAYMQKRIVNQGQSINQ